MWEKRFGYVSFSSFLRDKMVLAEDITDKKQTNGKLKDKTPDSHS